MSLAQKYFQIGYVVPDIQKAMAFFKGTLGVPEFYLMEKPELSDETYLGKPSPLQVNLAFGWAGQMQLELIEPLSGESTYSKFLSERPQGGMQHFALQVENFEAGLAEMKAKGYEPVQTGRNGETYFAYFDTTDSIGVYTEILHLSAEEMSAAMGMKKAANPTDPGFSFSS